MNGFEYHEEDDIAVFEYGDYDSYERSVDVANFVVDLVVLWVFGLKVFLEQVL